MPLASGRRARTRLGVRLGTDEPESLPNLSRVAQPDRAERSNTGNIALALAVCQEAGWSRSRGN